MQIWITHSLNPAFILSYPLQKLASREWKTVLSYFLVWKWTPHPGRGVVGVAFEIEESEDWPARVPCLSHAVGKVILSHHPGWNRMRWPAQHTDKVTDSPSGVNSCVLELEYNPPSGRSSKGLPICHTYWGSRTGFPNRSATNLNSRLTKGRKLRVGEDDCLPDVWKAGPPALAALSCLRTIRQQRRNLAWSITWCHGSPKGAQQALWSLGSGEAPAPSDTPVRSCVNYPDHVWQVCNLDKPQNCRAHNTCISQTCGLLLQWTWKLAKEDVLKPKCLSRVIPE